MKYSPFIENNKQIFIDKLNYNHIKQIKDLGIEEGYNVEFKENYEKDVQNKLAKIITSFANCDGGWLIIGIDDNTKEVTDIQKPNFEIELQINNKISASISPFVPKFRARFLENPQNAGHGVIVICVEEGLCPPYVTNGTIYMRNSSSSEPIKPERSTIDYLYKKRDYLSALTIKTFYNNELYDALKLDDEGFFSLIGQMSVLGDNISSISEQLAKTTFNDNFTNQENNTLDKATSQVFPGLKDLSKTFSDMKAAVTLSIYDYKNANEFFKNEINELEHYINIFSSNIDINKLTDLGNLKIEINKISLQYSWNYSGNEKEIKKCKELLNLHTLLKKYFEMKKSLSNLIDTNKLYLVISNEGYKFDEDITVSLYFPKGSFINLKKDLYMGIDNVDFNEDLLNEFKMNDISFIDSFDDYPILEPTIAPLKFNPLSPSSFADYKDPQYLLDIQKHNLEQICAYDLYHEKDYQLVKVHFNKLLANTDMFFPVPFVVNKNINKVKYKIKSKYSSTIIDGELNI